MNQKDADFRREKHRLYVNLVRAMDEFSRGGAYFPPKSSRMTRDASILIWGLKSTLGSWWSETVIMRTNKK